MSHFVKPDNQTLLWNVIQQSPLFQRLIPSERSKWFKNIIQYIYQNDSDLLKIHTSEDLLTFNKKTIQIMLSDLANNKASNDNIMPLTPDSTHPTIIPSTTISTTILKKDISESNLSLFDQKNKEFNDIFKNNIPANIDFSIKETDEPINDIDRLVKEHLKERDNELHNYALFHSSTNITPDISLNSNVIQPSVQPSPIQQSTANSSILKKLEALESKIELILSLLEKIKQ